MCCKLCHLIFVHRSKDFKAMKAGKLTIRPMSSHTLFWDENLLRIFSVFKLFLWNSFWGKLRLKKGWVISSKKFHSNSFFFRPCRKKKVNKSLWHHLKIMYENNVWEVSYSENTLMNLPSSVLPYTKRNEHQGFAKLHPDHTVEKVVQFRPISFSTIKS